MTAAAAQRLCEFARPDVALELFRPGTPFKRAYVQRDVEAWSTSGFARTSTMLSTTEEVLVLTRRGGSRMIVGGGSLEVLRWDGTCVSLMEDEVTFERPRHALHARIPWRRLGDDLRRVLTTDAKIRAEDSSWRKACDKSRFSAPSPECDAADERLSENVVKYVRSGGRLSTE